MPRKVASSTPNSLVFTHVRPLFDASVRFPYPRNSGLCAAFTRCAHEHEGGSVLLVEPVGCVRAKFVRHCIDLCDLQAAKLIWLDGLVHGRERVCLQHLCSELSGMHHEQRPQQTQSAAAALQHILQSLTKSGPLIFVLEHFERFVEQHNQMLLYTLLDASQHAAVFVCAMTSAWDVVESLEKRVRSRLSHWQLHLDVSDVSFELYTTWAHNLLLLSATRGNTAAQHWNASVQRALGDTAVRDVLRECHQYSRSTGALKLLLTNVCMSALKRQATQPAIALEDWQFALQLMNPPCSQEMRVKDLSVLEVCLLVAALNITERYPDEPFNFEMMQQEYRRFVNEYRAEQLKFDSCVYFKAFERLVQSGFLRCALDVCRQQQPAFTAYNLDVQPYVLRLAIQSMQVPASVHKWAGAPTDV